MAFHVECLHRSSEPRHGEAHGESSRGSRSADRAMSMQLLYVIVVRCESVALMALERAVDTERATECLVGDGIRTRHCRTSCVALAGLVPCRH